MATQAVRLPQPLTSEEIRTGIAIRISNAIEGLSEEQRTGLRDAIWESLGKTCCLNRQSYASFSASWDVHYEDSDADWRIDFNLDDFGRPVIGTVLGSKGNDPLLPKTVSGAIEAAPPDHFRRETSQPIPQPQVVQPKAENQAGLTRSVGRPKKARET